MTAAIEAWSSLVIWYMNHLPLVLTTTVVAYVALELRDRVRTYRINRRMMKHYMTQYPEPTMAYIPPPPPLFKK